MKIEFPVITAAVIAAVSISAAVAEGARSRPLGEDAALALLKQTLNRDHVYERRISMDCIAYGTEETTKVTFSSFSAKSTTRNAEAIPKQVLISTVTAFIVVPAKFSSGKQLKINGSRISRLRTK